MTEPSTGADESPITGELGSVGGLRSLLSILRRWASETVHAEDGTATLRDCAAWVKSRVVGRGSRRLRVILLASAAIQLVLAPITSWASDTPTFIGSVVALLYRGNPYATDQLFNPPLGSFLQAPFFAFLSLWYSPGALISNVASIGPAASVAGVSTQIPSPEALVALKLPLIIAMMLAGLCVAYISETVVGRPRSDWIAASWLLNPLVIWATAVHGEVDVLACAGVLLFLVAVLHRWYFLAGVALALGIISKAYPVVLVPCSLLAIDFHNRFPHERSVGASLARLGAGVGLTLLPFVIYLPNLESVEGGLSTASYGGFNPLLLFNPGEYPHSILPFPRLLTVSNADLVHSAFSLMFVLAIAGSVVLAYIASYVGHPPQGMAPSKTLVYALLWPVAAVLLFQTSPQPENLLLLIALLTVASCFSGAAVKVSLWLVTGAGMTLYLTLATPIAFFYPLAFLLGHGWISAFNEVVIAYFTRTPTLHQGFWIAAGVVGGGTILLLWIVMARSLAIELKNRIRDRASGVP